MWLKGGGTGGYKLHKYILTFNLGDMASLQIDKAVAFICRSVPVQDTK